MYSSTLVGFEFDITRVLSCQFSFVSCLIAAKCPNNTVGTINVGSRLKGKYNIAILGWSKANFWKGDGSANTAVMTTFSNSNKHKQGDDQNSNSCPKNASQEGFISSICCHALFVGSIIGSDSGISPLPCHGSVRDSLPSNNLFHIIAGALPVCKSLPNIGMIVPIWK